MLFLCPKKKVSLNGTYKKQKFLVEEYQIDMNATRQSLYERPTKFNNRGNAVMLSAAAAI